MWQAAMSNYDGGEGEKNIGAVPVYCSAQIGHIYSYYMPTNTSITNTYCITLQ